jgi:excisionase family DNA binding protein
MPAMESEGRAKLLTVEEFRDTVLGNRIGRASVYEMVRSNRIRAVRVGRKILIPAQEADRFLERELEQLSS